MRGLLLIPLALVACKETNPDFCPAHMDDPRCGGMNTHDAAVDSRGIDGTPADARLDFGSGAYAIKLTSFPTGPITITQPIDTNGSSCSADQLWVSLTQPGSCFIVATKITISTSIAVSGTRPLVLVATDALVLSGTLDAASHVATGDLGPASPETTCGGFLTAPASNSAGGGGGAGATFITKAGDGGYANNMTAVNGGTASNPVAAPTSLRAGCKGQAGGDGGTGGVGGDGGGAVFALAGNTIDLRAGVINASGGGGKFGSGKAGGGGGGSGGMIVLSASTILTDSASRLVANGGGGAAGTPGGGNGGEAITATPSVAALGSTSGNCGAGGDGSTNTGGAPGLFGAGNCGGGGGGGGGGYIQVSTALTSGAYSPAPVVQ